MVSSLVEYSCFECLCFDWSTSRALVVAGAT